GGVAPCPAAGQDIVPGDSCTVVLQTGYVLSSGSLTLLCPLSGGPQLSQPAPVALPRSCNVTAPIYGSLLAPCDDGVLSSYSSCGVSCSQGYGAVGSNYSCSLGVLSNSPDCVPLNCTAYPPPSHYNQSTCLAGSTQVSGASCIATCMSGY